MNPEVRPYSHSRHALGASPVEHRTNGPSLEFLAALGFAIPRRITPPAWPIPGTVEAAEFGPRAAAAMEGRR